MSQAVVDHFQQAFSSEVSHAHRLRVGFRVIPSHFLSALDREVSMEELKKTVFALPGDKVLGSDSFPLIFFYKFWSRISSELLEMIRGFLRRGELFKHVNSTFIALIPKKSVIATLGDIRPISLLTSLYKIVAKVLVERLKEVLPEVISGPQAAFVKDRLITDGVLVAQDCIHSKIIDGNLRVVIKLDMEKAYDIVEWKVLLEIMRNMGFSFRLPNDGPCVSHLQYADDTLLFCGAQRTEVSNIVVFLKCCEKVLGFKVNFTKTSMVGLICTEEDVSLLAQEFGCKMDKFPITYLGVPLSVGRLPIAVWDKILQCIQMKLDLWKFKYLSFEGRIKLIKPYLEVVFREDGSCIGNAPLSSGDNRGPLDSIFEAGDYYWSIGNLGVSGFGGVIRDWDGDVVLFYEGPLGVRTANFAELSALLFGLRTIVDRKLGHEFILEGDSRNVILWCKKEQLFP
ncbi:uncharacterized protein LOC18435054 [Amborella trichopoda]|uniref:uncharacterized protein LOC18435054 n=1 Tax=Amborella trichopoda TaxID=13333 RepID=UPI0009BF5CA0|nr:uncharacterized protein LOC18435054 [Amborella trichopoda]|eukprot:XP_020523344.1 uncharacterized protein LOC18435054 [Amborella trichopoda]